MIFALSMAINSALYREGQIGIRVAPFLHFSVSRGNLFWTPDLRAPSDLQH